MNNRVIYYTVKKKGIVLKPFIPNSKPPMILIEESQEIYRMEKYVNTIEDTLAGGDNFYKVVVAFTDVIIYCYILLNIGIMYIQ